MKLIRPLPIVLVLFAALTGCTGAGESTDFNGVKGLTPEICAQLDGIWENVADGGMQEKVEQWKIIKLFSWGKARYDPNGSIIIDLAATLPSVIVPGLAYVKVLRVKKVGANIYQFTTEDIPKGSIPSTPSITLSINDGGVIVFQNKIGGVPTNPESWSFIRYYGPDNPLP